MSNAATPADVTEAQTMRKRNVRLGLILASVVAAFFVGFVAKIVLLSHP